MKVQKAKFCRENKMNQKNIHIEFGRKKFHDKPVVSEMMFSMIHGKNTQKDVQSRKKWKE